MKSIRALAALGVLAMASVPVAAQAQTAPTRLTIGSFFNLNLAFGGGMPAFGNNNPAFGGVVIRPRIIITRITQNHPLAGFPVRRGVPVPPKPPKSPAAT